MRCGSMLFVVGAACVPLVNCGGGENADQGGTGLSYTGIETEARIDETNDRQLVETALIGSKAGGVSTLDATVTRTRPLLGRLVATLLGSVAHIDPGQGSFTSQAVVEDSDHVQGLCNDSSNPGGFSYNVQVDDQSGDFTGSLDFDNYDDCFGVFDGRAAFAGNIDLYTLQFTRLSLDTDALRFSDSVDSITLKGVIEATGTTVTLSAVFRDNNSARVYRIRNFLVEVLSATSTALTLRVSGRLYHPEHGYVTLSTQSPLDFTVNQDYPEAGELSLAGRNGSRTTLTVIDSTQYLLSTDSDGDGQSDSDENCVWGGQCMPTALSIYLP